ncbi:MAG: alginate export family protein [Nitrosomonas sp.]|uniref:alginate export family protein n=1 Tax=Nitrosomonas sp. TaxID=42353 RepID=UPI002717732C|nr:alginate export family protein [Nitrosomonas sp.]MDO8894911.1 alginate export family protein [Nitrosomonas sp.]MDO9470967.1 alginate export family protein [Nitrosomonas sp.]
MNSSSIFPFSAKPLAELKVHWVKSSQKWLFTVSLCCLGIMCLGSQAQAQAPANTNPNPPAAATTATAAAPSADYDRSKVPPVTAASRPGLFVLPPTNPGFYSLLDLITGNKREKPPVAPYAPFALLTTPAYDIDFRYLDTPGHEKDFFDPVKRMDLGNDWLLSFGGNFWYRYTHETDSRLNAAGTNNDFHMLRTRFHADLWYKDKVRLFAEGIDARAFGSELPPLVTDRNHADILNLFTDIKVASVNNGPVYVRVGRQEMLYGSQRLISTLDWVNTRRTFQGVKAFWRTPTWDVDAFWMRPMVIEKGNVDNWDTQQNFYGLWATNKPKPGHLVDLYFLSLDNNRNLSSANVLAGNILQGNSNLHTLGGRFAGNFDNLLYELEGMYQFGQRSNLDISAFAVATGVGYRLPLPMNPQGWIRYDFASGDSKSNDGRSNTFNQLFPFGHYYMGFLDRVGRQNIHDINAQFTLHPMPWVTFISQYHRFYLANNTDYLYNAAGLATMRDPTGQSGSHVGDEIDFRANFHVSRHQDVLVGYSKLFSGNYLEKQRPGISADLFYVQYNIRF